MAPYLKIKKLLTAIKKVGFNYDEPNYVTNVS